LYEIYQDSKYFYIRKTFFLEPDLRKAKKISQENDENTAHSIIRVALAEFISDNEKHVIRIRGVQHI
jgi:hypothetical protein